MKNLPPTHDLRSGRDVYVVAALDQEEIFRTATVERTLKLMFIYMQQLTITFTILYYIALSMEKILILKFLVTSSFCHSMYMIWIALAY